MTHVQPIKAGGVNCFLIQDEGLILVDTATPGQPGRILKQVKTQHTTRNKPETARKHLL